MDSFSMAVDGMLVSRIKPFISPSLFKVTLAAATPSPPQYRERGYSSDHYIWIKPKLLLHCFNLKCSSFWAIACNSVYTHPQYISLGDLCTSCHGDGKGTAPICNWAVFCAGWAANSLFSEGSFFKRKVKTNSSRLLLSGLPRQRDSLASYE